VDNVIEDVTGYMSVKSTVMEKGDMKLLKKWMGYKPKLTLLYRVSRDGDSKDDYWKMVENKENTIMVARSK